MKTLKLFVLLIALSLATALTGCSSAPTETGKYVVSEESQDITQDLESESEVDESYYVDPSQPSSSETETHGVLTPVESTYIGNANSMKFHYPECSSVDKMSPSNIVELGSRDEAINNGYVPCKRCNP